MPKAEPRTTARSRNVSPSTLQLDADAKQLLRELATGKTMGAFVSGLIRAEAAAQKARQEERERLRHLLDETHT